MLRGVSLEYGKGFSLLKGNYTFLMRKALNLVRYLYQVETDLHMCAGTQKLG